MEEIVQPDWEIARQIIQGWLVSNNRSLRNLAKEARIQPSIISNFLHGKTTLEPGTSIKLYNVIYQDMNPVDRRTFLKAVGLLPLALALGRDLLFTVHLQAADRDLARPHEAGLRLMLMGEEVAQRSWEEAIPLFRRAEEVLGGASSQAARSACVTAQLLINLGDYDKAREEAVRVLHTYEAVLDPETEAELCRIRGWLDYYMGNFTQSEKWFGNCLRIAEETGIERIGESAQHFLGRVYCAMGQTLRQRREADSFFHKAEVQFDKAYQIHLRSGTESQRAFDLLRKAQLLRVQLERKEEAQQLRIRARQMFGRDWGGVLHTDLEEARLALADGEIRRARLNAEEALRGWAQLKYTKGMADALQILGESEYIQMKVSHALELYVAALCVYPFENHLRDQQLWDEIADLGSLIARVEGRESYRRLVQHIQESIEERQGCFLHLNSVSANRTAAITRILSVLSRKASSSVGGRCQRQETA